MIDVKQLRIGNLVILSEVDTEKIIKITSINNVQVINTYNGICLIPALLEKCGGKKIIYGSDQWYIGKLKFTFGFNTEGSTYLRFHYSGKVAYLRYLHQLQNLYFALTGEELEINL